MIKITILVGDAEYEVVNEPVTHVNANSFNLLPADLIKSIEPFTKRTEGNVVFRIYNDTILNWIGEQIERQNISNDDVEVVTEQGIHYFDNRGVIDNTWPYEIFNY